MNTGSATTTAAFKAKTNNEASAHSQSKSLRKLVKSARHAMEKREGSNHKDNNSNKRNPSHTTPLTASKPIRGGGDGGGGGGGCGGGRFQRSVDNVVPPPPPGGVTLSSSLPSTPKLGMTEMAQRLKEELNHNSISSISNVSSIGAPSLKITHNNMYNSLSSISNVSSVKPRRSDGRLMTAFGTVTEESLSSLHDSHQDSFNSSFSDLTSSQDLSVSRNSFSNSFASLNATGAHGTLAEHKRKQPGASIGRLKVTSIHKDLEPLSEFAGSSHTTDSGTCYPSINAVTTENVLRRSVGSLEDF
jgi:hypothetical protein